MIEQGARLGKILDYLELSQTAVSQSIGQSQSYISQMIKGTRRISRTAAMRSGSAISCGKWGGGR